MKHTPEFYQQVHNLDELLQRALTEKDGSGKRRTLGEAFKLFNKYREQISEYLKTPEPVPPQPPRKVALGRLAKSSWLHYGLNRLRALKSEIREESREHPVHQIIF